MSTVYTTIQAEDLKKLRVIAKHNHRQLTLQLKQWIEPAYEALLPLLDCPECGGSGDIKANGAVAYCSNCNGTGKVKGELPEQDTKQAKLKPQETWQSKFEAEED